MKELSLHILDIAKNSVRAKAANIGICVREDRENDLLIIQITDDGCGMEASFLKTVCDPFTTTRTTRKAGLGIPLFAEAARQTNGDFDIRSQPGVGTAVTAVFGYHHIDRAPLGDMATTLVTLVAGSPEIDFLYHHEIDGRQFSFSTKEVREQLGQVPLSNQDVLLWISAYIEEGLASIGYTPV